MFVIRFDFYIDSLTLYRTTKLFLFFENINVKNKDTWSRQHYVVLSSSIDNKKRKVALNLLFDSYSFVSIFIH